MEMKMATRDSSRPLASVMTQVVSDLAFLLQTEFRLARAEVGEKMSQAANGAMSLGIAGVLSLGGLLVLLLAAVRWLEVAGRPDRSGYIPVGGVALAAGGLLAVLGVNCFKACSR